jgi:hypothetical protein
VLCRAWLQHELDEGDPLTYAAADAKAGAILRRLELEERERKLLDPTEAKRLRRANDPNYKGPGDGKNKRKAGDDDSDEDDEDGGGKRAKTADADGEEKEKQGLGGGARRQVQRDIPRQGPAHRVRQELAVQVHGG